MQPIWGTKNYFEPTPINKGVDKSTVPWPVKDDEKNKKLFGIELAKDHRNHFEAALIVFGADTAAALWVSQNWLTDPVVIASRDLYLKTFKLETSLLDKDQLAVKLLQFAEEKTKNGEYFLHESKDRLAALKLYSEVMGYTGKVEVDNSTKKFIHNEMIIKLVEAEPKKQEKIVDVTPNDNEEILNNVEPIPMKIKLVS